MNAISLLDPKLCSGLISIVTFIWGATFLGWILLGKFRVENTRDIFICVITYYGLCVPLDLSIGLEVRGAREDLADLNLAVFSPVILQVLLLHSICAGSFLFMYRFATFQSGNPYTIKNLNITLPSIRAVCAFNIMYVIFYVSLFGAQSRLDRLYMARTSMFYKVVSVSTTLLLAFNLLYLLKTSSRERGGVVVLFSALLSLITGSRIWLALFGLLFASRHRIRFTPVLILGMSLFCFVYGVYWKGFAHEYWQNGRISFDPDVIAPAIIGTSTIDGIGPYVIAVETIDSGRSPLWMGWSYTVLTGRVALPRFLSSRPQLTLAEGFTLNYREAKYDKGGGSGFSAIAECWLNFGVWGPVLLGAFCGWISKHFDVKSRGPAYIVFLIMTVRLFRSDFASLFKSWVVLLGGCLFCILTAFYLYNSLVRQHRSRLGGDLLAKSHCTFGG